MASGTIGIQYVTGEKVEHARALRRNMTPTETFLWEYLRNRKCGGFKFRRQQIIEGFVADFYCEVAQLVVEVDGGIHDDSEVKKNDEHRETVFKARGITTIRFKNEVVCQSIDIVKAEITEICEKNREKSKLAEWEKQRLLNSGAHLSSGGDFEMKESDITPLTSGEGQGVRS
jgi:very-short-patch-repair endonuclease